MPIRGKQIFSFCPIHESDGTHRRRSLSLNPRTGLNCFAGCKYVDIADALYRRVGKQNPRSSIDKFSRDLDSRREKSRPSQRPWDDSEIVKIYQFWDLVDGEWILIAEKARYERPDEYGGKKQKTFKWRLAGGSFNDGLKDPLSGREFSVSDMPLYGIREAVEALQKDPNTTVIFTEGEKARDACQEHGLIAVSGGGGSGTRSFGTALRFFTDVKVAIFADNDDVGRKYAQTLMVLLGDVGARCYTIQVPRPLPPSGDAVEYFAAGGTAQELLSNSLIEPVFEPLGADDVQVRMPFSCESATGQIVFRLSNIVPTGRDVEGRIKVMVDAPGIHKYPFQRRINIMSHSATRDLRLDLEDYLQELGGKKLGLTEMINTSFSIIADKLGHVDRSVDAADIEFTTFSESMDVDPILPASAPTTWFGDGSASKTMLSLSMAISYATGIPWLGRYRTPQKPVLYIDWEGDKERFGRRIKRLCDGMDIPYVPHNMIHYWSAEGYSFNDQIDAILAKIRKNNIGLVIIDSVGPAMGGAPEETLPTLTFYRAIQKLPCTSLIIAHINRKGETNKPFGNSFHHNEVRRTWYVERTSGSDSRLVDVGMYCKKVNDGPDPMPLGIQISYVDPDGPIKLHSLNHEEVTVEIVRNRSTEKPMANRIYEILDEPLTLEGICSKINIPMERYIDIATVLIDNSYMFEKQGTVVGEDGIERGLWARATIKGDVEIAPVEEYPAQENEVQVQLELNA